MDTADTQANIALPLELSNDFNAPDIFEIPAIDEPDAIITVVSAAAEAALPDNWKKIPVRQILAMYSVAGSGDAGRIMRALHILQWRTESRFCGSCGAENSYVSSSAHRLCPKCGRLEFPRICPAIMAVITDDENRILLAHNKIFRKGLYSHISGFNEAGESLEETVAREIREEINIEVKDIVYVKSQPWPFPNSLMTGYKARYLSGAPKPDGEEIIDVQWFSLDNLPVLPGEGSLSRYLIDLWLEGNL